MCSNDVVKGSLLTNCTSNTTISGNKHHDRLSSREETVRYRILAKNLRGKNFCVFFGKNVLQ